MVLSSPSRASHPLANVHRQDSERPPGVIAAACRHGSQWIYSHLTFGMVRHPLEGEAQVGSGHPRPGALGHRTTHRTAGCRKQQGVPVLASTSRGATNASPSCVCAAGHAMAGAVESHPRVNLLAKMAGEVGAEPPVQLCHHRLNKSPAKDWRAERLRCP